MINPNQLTIWWFSTLKYISSCKVTGSHEIYLRTKARESKAVLTMWWFLTGENYE